MIDSDNPIFKKKSTLNPYYRAAGLFFSRMIWDLNYESWRSRKIIRNWKDRFEGQKAVIVCNGPSLLKSDLGLLSDTFCFGLNKINLLFETSTFRPNCIVAVNPFVLEQNANFYNKTNIPLFVDSIGLSRKYIKRRENIAYLHSGPRGFARDCSISICQGYTVTYVALQLAFHMGFRKVALIGADHNFSTKGPANKLVRSTVKDPNHFDPRYFSGGDLWQLPDLNQSEFFYSQAREVYDAYGGQVVNATEGGYLEVFDRMTLSNFLDL